MTVMNTYLTRMALAGYRPQTLRVRRITLTSFARTVPSLLHATREDCEAWLARPLSPASRRSYAAHLRAFYRYCLDEGLRADDPTAKLPRFREPKGVPRPISDADLALALDHADPRMRAWLLLMALAGLRCIEVAALEPRDILLTDDGAMLHLRECKGGGTALVPAHPAVLDALTPLRQNGGLWWRVNAHTVSEQVSRYLRSLNIDATAHQLRHWAGTAFYEASGHDLLTTAALLRHVNVATTQIYARVNPDRPAEVVRLVPVP